MSRTAAKFIDKNTTDMDEAMTVLIRALSAASEVSLSTLYPSFEPYTFGFDTGPKYHKVWQDNGTQKMVCFFVERANGDVWKGSWKAPVKNFVRGNILTVEGRRALTIDKVAESGYFYPGI